MTQKAFKTAAGATDMVVAGDTKFFVEGPMRIERVEIPLVDTTGNGTWDKFGALTKLTLGIKIEQLRVDDTVREDFTADGTIRQNMDWCRLAGRDGWNPGVSTTAYCVRWSPWKYQNGITIQEGEKLQMHIQDALTGLDFMRADAQGSIPL